MFYTHLLLKGILSTKQSHRNCNTYCLGIIASIIYKLKNFIVLTKQILSENPVLVHRKYIVF